MDRRICGRGRAGVWGVAVVLLCGVCVGTGCETLPAIREGVDKAQTDAAQGTGESDKRAGAVLSAISKVLKSIEESSGKHVEAAAQR